jgi:hypothetical protein
MKSMTSLGFDHFAQAGDVEQIDDLELDKYEWWQGTIIRSIDLPADKVERFKDSMKTC